MDSWQIVISYISLGCAHLAYPDPFEQDSALELADEMADHDDTGLQQSALRLTKTQLEL